MSDNIDGAYAKKPWEMTENEIETMIRKGEQEASDKGVIYTIVKTIRGCIRDGTNPFVVLEMVAHMLKQSYEETGDIKKEMDRMAFIATVIEETATEILGKDWEKRYFTEYLKLAKGTTV